MKLGLREWHKESLIVVGLGLALWARVGGMFSFLDIEGHDSATAVHRLYLLLESPWGLDLVWEPLYTLYLAVFHVLTSDAHLLLLTSRFAALFVIVVLIYAIGRRFLGPVLGLVLALWWIALPEGIAPRFSKHVFYFAVLMMGAWMALHVRNLWGRVGLILFLAVGALTLRQEIAVMVVFLAAVFFTMDAQAATKLGRGAFRRLALAYGGGALLLGVGVFLFLAYGAHSYSDGWRGYHAALVEKHSFNLCHVHAYGFIQRNPLPFPGQSPWDMAVCEGINAQVYGTSRPTLLEMAQANPAALLEYFSWNLSFVPGATSSLIFGAYAGDQPVDFMHKPYMRAGPWVPWALAAWLAAVLVGVTLLARRADGRDLFVRSSAFWVYSGAALAMTAVVILTQRPRPVYILYFGFFLMLLSALGVRGFLQTWLPSGPDRRVAVRWLILLAALLAIPDHFRAHAEVYGDGDRPRLGLYRLVAQHYAIDLAQQKQHRWMTPETGEQPQVFAYLRPFVGRRFEDARQFSYLRFPAGALPADVYSQIVAWDVNMVYFDDRHFARRQIAWGPGLAAMLEARGWRRIEGTAQNRLLIAPP